MNIYSIYKATNITNGKSYIGFTSLELSIRIKQHKKLRYDSKFYDAILKHGWNSFEWELLYQSKDGDYCKNIMETHFIKEYDTYKNGYNSTLGGDGILDYIHTEETKKKMSLSAIGRVFSEETRKKLSEAHKGKIISEETRKKMGAASKGRIFSEESKKKMSLSAIGKKHTQESKKKISEANKGRVFSEEHKKKISEAKKKMFESHINDGEE